MAGPVLAGDTQLSALLPLLPVPSDLSFLDWYITTGIAQSWQTHFVDEALADYRVHPTNMHGTMIRDRTGERTIAAGTRATDSVGNAFGSGSGHRRSETGGACLCRSSTRRDAAGLP